MVYQIRDYEQATISFNETFKKFGKNPEITKNDGLVEILRNHPAYINMGKLFINNEIIKKQLNNMPGIIALGYAHLSLLKVYINSIKNRKQINKTKEEFNNLNLMEKEEFNDNEVKTIAQYQILKDLKNGFNSNILLKYFASKTFKNV